MDILAQHECPAITARRSRRAEALGQSDTDPIVWKEALGSNAKDVDGNIFVDLTAGFGVAGAGHRHPKVAAAQPHRANNSFMPWVMLFQTPSALRFCDG